MNLFDGLRLAIVLPAYNEHLTIRETIESFWKECPEAEIVVVNNNSTDATEMIARSTLEELNARGRVINELRQGKGNAVRRAFTDVDADVYVLCDADLTYPAAYLFDLARPIVERKADLVVGDRLSDGHYARENKRRFHGFGNELVRWLINRLFSANLHDIMSGYRAFSRQFVKNYPILVEGFQLETDMTLHALDKRFRLLEIPVPYKDRPEGSTSKLNTFRDGAKVIFTIAQVLRHYRPVVFFGTASVVFALAGFAAAGPVIQDWILHRYIYHVPLAVLSAAFEICAIVALGIGLMLDSINHNHRLDAERRLLGD